MTPPVLPEMEALEPCPFCGGEAERRKNELSGLMTMAHCRQCGASAFDRKWNRRASASEQAVKGLTWETFCSRSGNCSAKTPFGEYVIQSETDGWGLYLLNEQDAHTAYSTLDFAKAAAQADFEARIRSALKENIQEPVALNARLQEARDVRDHGDGLRALRIEDQVGDVIKALMLAENGSQPTGPHYWPDGLRKAAGRFIALTAALSRTASREGMVLVPSEPTPEMLGAWYRYKNGHRFAGEPPATDTSDVGAYRAMLAASPNSGGTA